MDKNSIQEPPNYYDWKLIFKKNLTPRKDKSKERLNSLGIRAKDFEKFIKKWKKVKLYLK